MCVWLIFPAIICNNGQWTESLFFNWQINKLLLHHSEGLIRDQKVAMATWWGSLAILFNHQFIVIIIHTWMNLIDFLGQILTSLLQLSVAKLKEASCYRKRNQRAREESIFPDSCPVIWHFLLCFISTPQCLIETRTDMSFNSNRQYAHNNILGFYCLEDLTREKKTLCGNIWWCSKKQIK